MATDRLFNQTQGDSLLAILAQIRDGYNSVDGAFSLTSENPLQNKKITGAVTDIIETLGGTAQKSYAIGQYFLANDGYYYVATAAITAGSSNISSSTGGNCSKTCITAAMNNLSSQISNLITNESNLSNKFKNFQSIDNYVNMVFKNYTALTGVLIANYESVIVVTIAAANVSTTISTSGYRVTYLAGQSEQARIVIDGAVKENSGGTIRLKMHTGNNTTFLCNALLISGAAYFT